MNIFLLLNSHASNAIVPLLLIPIAAALGIGVASSKNKKDKTDVVKTAKPKPRGRPRKKPSEEITIQKKTTVTRTIKHKKPKD